MKENSFEAYRQALKDAEPEMVERVLHRAEQEGDLTAEQYQQLVALAYRDRT